MTRVPLRTPCLAALLCAGAGACFACHNETGDLILDGPPRDGIAECQEDEDCVPAGSSCCECPTFALPETSGWEQSCEEVNCPVPASCSETEAACEAGSCVLRCTPIRCDTVCENGFVADALGCLICPETAAECGGFAPPAPACEHDSECVQVPADCCGCARGGVDTAVPAVEADSYLDGMVCDDEPSCPEVDACDPELVSLCIAGSCQLGTLEGDEGSDAGTGPWLGGSVYCGTPDYPPCPEGQVCVLNDPAAPDANSAGVGVCRPGD